MDVADNIDLLRASVPQGAASAAAAVQPEAASEIPAARAKAPGDTDSRSGPLRNSTVMMVDDDPIMLEVVQTYLEEAGYVTAQADGAKRLYTITAEGRAHLESNRAFVDAVLERLDAVGERMRSRRGDDEEDRGRGPRVPRLVRAALENLREVAADRLKDNGDTEAKVVEVLARAAAELKKS